MRLRSKLGLIALLLLAPLAARAQLTLSLSDGTPIGSTYNMGQVAAGVSKDVRFRAGNPGNAAVPITTLGLSGDGFSITSPLTKPPNIPPGSFLDVVLHFAGGPPASYSANFQINGISVLVVVASVPAATLSVISGCTGPDPASSLIGFGQVQSGQSTSCVFSLQNLNTQSIAVSSIAVSGASFQLAKSVAMPLSLPPGAAATFSIVFAPTSAAVDSGMLTIDTQTYPLSGTALNAPLPTPILEFDPGAPASGQQRTITMRLPSPSPLTASGSVNLVFQPDTSLVSGDPAVVFTATGARSVPFSIQPGDVAISLGNQPGAVFQTGTTSGRITFTVSINVAMAGDPTTVMIVPPSVVAMESASAVARAGALDVQVTGFDNTYSTGAMSFTFYDLAGKTIGAAVPANFTTAFHSYFASGGGGGAFQMLVSFPVTGQANQVGAVDLTMTNSAGPTLTRHLTFINDTGQCVVVSSSEILCPGSGL